MQKRIEAYVNVAIVATILFIAVAAVIGVPATVIVFFAGFPWAAERYLDRCRYCGSWRVTIREEWVACAEPGWVEATRYRICKRCGTHEIDHFPLRDMDPLHPS